MPVNRNALIRFKTIDKCLQRRNRKWTLEDLIDACSDALYEYEGIDKGVSKRTVQADIQLMRSDKLGYNAPIIVTDKKYYSYEDPDYSITNIPLTDQDLGMLTDAVAFMKQFKGFSHFRDLDSMVQKLEDHIYSQKTHTKPVIDFEKNDNLKGLEFLDRLYKAIIKKEALKITYQSFKARSSSAFDFHPYLLKEFRNRWFIIGVKNGEQTILNLALDRLVEVEESDLYYQEPTNFDADTYFKNAIGVSISTQLKPEEILLWVSSYHAPYVLTKPLHHSQKLVEKDYYGITISLKVQLNYELEKEILSFGESVKVLAPERLKRVIKERLNASLDLYNSEISEKGLAAAVTKLQHKGGVLLQYVFTKRELKVVEKLIQKELETNKEANFLDVISTNKNFKTTIFNKNLKRLIQQIAPNATLIKAHYYDKAPTQQQWQQDGFIQVEKQQKTTKLDNQTVVIPAPDEVLSGLFGIQIYLDDTTEANGLENVFWASHQKRFDHKEIELITNNSLPATIEAYVGSVFVKHPLLLSSIIQPFTNKKRRMLYLEFCAAALPENFKWREPVSIL